jgi:AGZA family xanthine/uracil permease-like MFS transporter
MCGSVRSSVRHVTFDLRARGTTASREVLAGATTFAAMSYIIVVNPLILASTGMDRSGLLLATVLSAAISTLIMGLWANLPIALAPGMGTNIVFSQILVMQMGVSWQSGLAMILLNSLIFLVLSLSRWRQRIVAAFPEPIKLGMQCSIGMLVAYLGLKNGGLIVTGAGGSISFGSLSDPVVMMITVAIVLTPMLVVLRVPGALLISIAGLTVAGLFVRDAHGAPLTQAPAHWFAVPSLSSNLILALDFRQFFGDFWKLLPVTLYFLLSEFFAGTTTLLSVTRRAGLLDANGEIPRARAAFSADALASTVGALLGTTTVTAFAESVTGVEAGGRTGLVAVVVAILFALSLFAAPLIGAVPVQNTAPALLLVGILMLEGLGGMDTARPEAAIPPLAMTIVTACTADLMVGLAIGAFVYTAILAGLRQWQRLGPAVLLLDAVLVMYLVLRSLVLH